MREALHAYHVGWVLLLSLALLGLYSYSYGSTLRAPHAGEPNPLLLRTPQLPLEDDSRQQQRRTAQPLSVCEQPVSTTMAAGFKESYSVWATPKGKLGEQLRAEIVQLAARYGATPFPPHLTVLGDIERPRQEAEALMRELAAQVKKYRVNFVEVTRGTFFYQCVYLLVAKDEGTMAAAAAARSVFGMTTGPYMPHLSLLYADLDDAEKAKGVDYETSRLYGESSGYDTLLVETGYEVGSLALWYTPTDDKSLQSWCLVDEYQLS